MSEKLHTSAAAVEAPPSNHANGTALSPALASAASWDILRDSTAPLIDRSDALAELLQSTEARAAVEFLLLQLADANLQADWREAIVFVAEDVHLAPEFRPVTADRLLTIAAQLRSEPDGKDKVVWCALRRGASLINAEQIDRLLPFLDASGSVDTRAVALRSVARVFAQLLQKTFQHLSRTELPRSLRSFSTPMSSRLESSR